MQERSIGLSPLRVQERRRALYSVACAGAEMSPLLRCMCRSGEEPSSLLHVQEWKRVLFFAACAGVEKSVFPSLLVQPRSRRMVSHITQIAHFNFVLSYTQLHYLSLLTSGTCSSENRRALIASLCKSKFSSKPRMLCLIASISSIMRVIAS